MTDQKRPPIIVTGDTGFLGRALVHHFAGRFPVVGFNRGGERPDIEGVEAEAVDLTSDDAVRDGLRAVRERHGSRVASVLHLAAYYSFSGEPSTMYEDLTVRGTQRLLRALRDFEVEQFVFSSTMLVHAPCEPGERIDESWPLEPKWDYPESKLQTERLILRERGEIPAVLLRISGVYDDECNSIPLAQQIQRIFEKQITSRVYPGDISRGQSFMHLDDLIDAFDRVVERRDRLPEETALLLGEADPLSYDEVQRILAREIHDEEWETQQIPKAMAKAGAWLQDTAPIEDPFIKPWMVDLADDHYALDLTAARRLLDWQPRRSLRETLPRMVQALRRDPQAFYRANDLGEVPADARDIAGSRT
jgi:nucleoside-diphosphate-sugar epimerase